MTEVLVQLSSPSNIPTPTPSNGGIAGENVEKERATGSMPIRFVESNTKDSTLPRYILRIDELITIVESAREEVGEGEIVFLTISGAARTGKSFLLSLLVRYLTSGVSEYPKLQDEWWTNADFDIHSFPWKGGDDRCTSGIWIWPDPFAVGDNRFVFLIDAEGMFNSKSEDSMLMAMMIFFSSYLMVNVKGTVDTHLMKLLAMCGDMSLRLKTIQCTQQNLNPQNDTGTEVVSMNQIVSEDHLASKVLFLLRDWSYSYQRPFGKDGGQTCVESLLKEDPEDAADVMEAKLMITKSFTPSGFLLPNPGKGIAECEAELPLSKCKISERFKTQFSELCQYLFRGRVLIGKRNLLGTPLRLQDFPHYAQKVCTLAVTYVKPEEQIKTYRHMLVSSTVESSFIKFTETALDQPMENQEQFERALQAASEAVNRNYQQYPISVDTPMSASRLEVQMAQFVEGIREQFKDGITRYALVLCFDQATASDPEQERETIMNEFKQSINCLELGSDDFTSAVVSCFHRSLMTTHEFLPHVQQTMTEAVNQISKNRSGDFSITQYESILTDGLENSKTVCRNFLKEHGVINPDFERIISHFSRQSRNSLLGTFSNARKDLQIIKECVKCERYFNEEVSAKSGKHGKTELEKILQECKQNAVDRFLKAIGQKNCSSTMGQNSRNDLEAAIDEEIEMRKLKQRLLADACNRNNDSGASHQYPIKTKIGNLVAEYVIPLGAGFAYKVVAVVLGVAFAYFKFRL